MRCRAGVDQVVDMQGRVVRTDNRRADIAALHIAPRPGVAIDAAIAPADHRMGAVEIGICQMLRADQVRQVFASCRHRHDQADMHTVGLDEYRDTAIGFAPVGIGRDKTPDQRAEEIDTHQQQWPADNRPKSAAKAVDAKQFQV